MNRFIVIIEEDYDQYSVCVPHPLNTTLTKGEIWVIMQNYGQKVIDSWNNRDRWKSAKPYDDFLTIDNIKINETCFLATEVYENDGARSVRYCVKMPEILEIDEWFERGQNEPR